MVFLQDIWRQFSSAVSCSQTPFFPFPSGLVTRDFRGVTNVQEVECVGRALSSDQDLLTMSIFTAAMDTAHASVNFANRECLTSDQFSSCFIDEADSKSTRLKTLVSLREGEVRVLGCNVSCFVPGGRVQTVSWFVTLVHTSKCFSFTRRGPTPFKQSSGAV